MNHDISDEEIVYDCVFLLSCFYLFNDKFLF